MTARDNLALCAMQVLLKQDNYEYVSFWQRIRRFFGFSYHTKTADPIELAIDAYEIADAMIEASEMQKEE